MARPIVKRIPGVDGPLIGAYRLPRNTADTPSQPPPGQTEIVAPRRGDEAAFAGLVGEYSFRELRVARMCVSSHAVAEEVVPGGVARRHLRDGRFEGRASLKTWNFRILA